MACLQSAMQVAWDFPLSRKEKTVRLVLLSNQEIQLRDGEYTLLEEENAELREALEEAEQQQQQQQQGPSVAASARRRPNQEIPQRGGSIASVQWGGSETVQNLRF